MANAKIILALILLAIYGLGQTKEIDTKTIDEHTKKLLAHPFDLLAFKKKKKSANSGSAKAAYFLKPGKGIYWHFMLFPPGAGYWGNIPATDIHLENGLEMVTFQPPGKNQNQYINPEETLIQVIERYNDIDLPQLAFVGLDTTEIKKRLGQYNFKKNNCFVYFNANNLLTLHIRKREVNWIKYTRLNFNVTEENIPTELLNDK